MSAETAHIAACTVNPRDSLPRLVYADWQGEQNDSRGEMVRVTEELRRHPVWADEYRRLCPARNRRRQDQHPDDKRHRFDTATYRRRANGERNAHTFSFLPGQFWGFVWASIGVMFALRLFLVGR